MLDWTMPGETEMGSAGEQPIKGYLGQAHQTMSGRGVNHGASPIHTSSDDRPAMPQKTHPENRGTGPQTCVQRTGRGTNGWKRRHNECYKQYNLQDDINSESEIATQDFTGAVCRDRMQPLPRMPVITTSNLS